MGSGIGDAGSGESADAASACASRTPVASPESLPLEWSFHPWRDFSGPPWRRPAVALLLIAASALLAGVSFSYPAGGAAQNPAWPLQAAGLAVLSMLVLSGMNLSLFLPARYKLDDKGVRVTFAGVATFRPWSHYRNFYAHDTGVHLTTMPTPSALDPFRGHLLLYGPAADRGALKALLSEKIRK